MKHAEYVYTIGMDESELEAYLRAGHHGVLGLADGDDAYAIPISYYYDTGRLVLRVSGDQAAGDKQRFLATTATATFVCYQADANDSWSILVRGPIQEFTVDVDEATINDWFQPFRLFDEAVEDVDFRLYELRPHSIIGRRTTG